MKELTHNFVAPRDSPEIVFQKFGLRSRGPWRSSASGLASEISDPASRFRNALDELGGLYAAFGQFLSWRADLLRTDYLGRLRHIKAAVPPIPRDMFAETLSSELGGVGAELAAGLHSEPCWNTLARCAYRTEYQGRQIAIQLARDPIPDAAFELFEKGIVLIEEERLADALGGRILTRFREWMRLSDSAARERSYLEALHSVRENTIAQYPILIPGLSTARVVCTEWIEGESLSSLIAQGSPEAAQRAAECALEQICMTAAIDTEFDPDSMAITPAGRLVIRRANRLLAIPPPLTASCLKYISAVLASNAPAAAQALVRLSSGSPAMHLESRLLAELSNLEPELKVNLQFPASAAVFEGNWRALRRAGEGNPLFLDMMHRNLIAVGYWNAETAPPHAPARDYIVEAQWPVLGRLLQTRLGQLANREATSDWFIGSGLLFFEMIRQMNRVAEGLRENDLSVGVDVQADRSPAHAHRRIRHGIFLGMLLVLFLASLRFAASASGTTAVALAAVAFLAGCALFWFVARFD